MPLPPFIVQVTMPPFRPPRSCVNDISGFRLTALMVSMLMFMGPGALQADPLPSWRDGATKEQIVAFVTEVATPGGPGYVPPAERIAVFDDDGTLWPEKPRVQALLALKRLRERAPHHPEWRTLLPYRAALELGDKYALEATPQAAVQLLAAAHADRPQDGFQAEAQAWLAAAVHPRYGVPWSQLAYVPMGELMAWLKANGFRIFVVGTGSVELVRVLARTLYGIPSDDVIGSSVVTGLGETDGRTYVRRQAITHGLNDGRMKPLSIDLHIGLRPLLAVGNVGGAGDIDMLRYSQGQGRPTLQLLVNHDDFQREYAYEEPSRASLNAAERHGWRVISMRYEWRRLFGFPQAEPATRGLAGP